MIRVLFFVFVLIALAAAEVWLVERPGEIILTWQGHRITTSLVVALGVLLLAGGGLVALASLLRLLFGVPLRLSASSTARRRDKGYAALSRGMIAVGEGDVRLARQSAAEAQRLLRNEPLTLLLKAQAAQLADDREQAEAAFRQMSERKDTRLLGLRGLHMEAQRRGDTDAAHQFASTAHEIAALPWTAKAVIEHRTASADWESALAALRNSSTAKALDKKTRERQLSVLETAVGLEKEDIAPDAALQLARSAMKREPHLVPAIALTARLMFRKGAGRKAAKLIETVWLEAPHPDLAKLYVDQRPGDTSAERLARAKTLARLNPNAPESRMMVAQASITAGEFKSAREAMLPLIEAAERPTTRMCLIMADLERAEHGASGYVAEWLARASRAPHDPAWVADGVISDHWRPASPITGKLDAFVWQRPIERLSNGAEAEDAIYTPITEPPARPLLTQDNGARTPDADPEIIAEKAQAQEPLEPEEDEPPAAQDQPDRGVFPLPGAPDDPGPEPEKSQSKPIFR